MASRKAIVVLTVEPGETALSTRKLIIESAGFNCLSTVSGKQAIETARAHPVHAALIDVDTDDMPLRDLIGSLRQYRPELRVYILSNHGWADESLRPEISRTFQKLSDPRVIVEELSRAFPEEA